MDPRDLPLHEAVSAFKRTLVLEVLAAHGGNRSRAAAALKIERTSLLRLIRELRIADASGGQPGRPPLAAPDGKPGRLPPAGPDGKRKVVSRRPASRR
jgi:hypothetical protein